MAKHQENLQKVISFVSDVSFTMHGSPEGNGVLYCYTTLGTLESLDVPNNFLFTTQQAAPDPIQNISPQMYRSLW